MKKERKFCGFDSVFATRLRALMESRKITQLELSKQIGTTRQAVSQYFDGSVLPNIEKLYLIAEFFKVSADYLLGNTDSLKTDSNYKEINKLLGLSDDTITVLTRSANGRDIYDVECELFGRTTTLSDDISLPDGNEKYDGSVSLPMKNYEIVNELCKEIINTGTIHFDNSILQLIGDYLSYKKNENADYAIYKHSDDGSGGIDDIVESGLNDDEVLAIKIFSIQRRLNKLKSKLDEERAKKEEQAKKKEGQKDER